MTMRSFGASTLFDRIKRGRGSADAADLPVVPPGPSGTPPAPPREGSAFATAAAAAAAAAREAPPSSPSSESSPQLGLQHQHSWSLTILLHQVPSLPSAYVRRRGYAERVVDELLCQRGEGEDAVGAEGSIRRKGPPTVVIYAKEPQGKTTLAAALATEEERIAENFTSGVLWLNVGRGGENILCSLLRALAVALNEEGRDGDEQEGYMPYRYGDLDCCMVNLAVMIKTTNWAAKGMVVLDDVSDSRVVEVFQSLGVTLLVTTRSRSVAEWGCAGGGLIELGCFSPDEAVEALGLAACAPRRSERSVEGKGICKAIGFNPRAVAIAGMALEEKSVGDWLQLSAQLQAENAKKGPGEGSSSSISSSGSGSSSSSSSCVDMRSLVDFNLRTNFSAADRSKFATLGVLPPDLSVTTELLGLLWGQETRTARLLAEGMSARALLKKTAPGLFAMHREGSAAAKGMMEEEDLRRQTVAAPSVRKTAVEAMKDYCCRLNTLKEHDADGARAWVLRELWRIVQEGDTMAKGSALCSPTPTRGHESGGSVSTDIDPSSHDACSAYLLALSDRRPVYEEQGRTGMLLLVSCVRLVANEYLERGLGAAEEALTLREEAVELLLEALENNINSSNSSSSSSSSSINNIGADERADLLRSENAETTYALIRAYLDQANHLMVAGKPELAVEPIQHALRRVHSSAKWGQEERDMELEGLCLLSCQLAESGDFDSALGKVQEIQTTWSPADAAGLGGSGICAWLLTRIGDVAAKVLRDRDGNSGSSSGSSSSGSSGSSSEPGETALAAYGRALLAIQNIVGEDHPLCAVPLERRASLLLGLGRSGEALDEVEGMLSILRKAHGDGNAHPKVAATDAMRARAMIEQGEAERAQEILEQALEQQEATFGKDHILTAQTMLLLAICGMGDSSEDMSDEDSSADDDDDDDDEDEEHALGGGARSGRERDDFEREEELLRRSVAVFESYSTTPATEESSTKSSDSSAGGDWRVCRQQLGEACGALGLLLERRSSKMLREVETEDELGMDYEVVIGEAEDMLKRHMDLAEEASEEEGTLEAKKKHLEATKRFIHFQQANGDESKAESLMWDIQHLTAQVYGPKSLEMCMDFERLARFLSSHGATRYSEAEPLFAKSLRIREAVLGRNHPSVGEVATRLGGVLVEQQSVRAAEPLFKRALDIVRQQLGEGAPMNRTQELLNLGMVLSKQGRYDEAEPLIREAVDVGTRLYGEETAEVITQLNMLAVLVYAQGRHTEAEPMLKKVLDLREVVLGKSHPDVAESLTNLAAYYNSKGTYSMALPMFERAMHICRESYGETHPETLSCMGWLAELHEKRREYPLAGDLLTRMLQMQGAGEGQSSMEIAETLSALAELRCLEDKFEEAEHLHKRSLEMREREVGPNHSSVADTAQLLALVLSKAEKHMEANFYQQVGVDARDGNRVRKDTAEPLKTSSSGRRGSLASSTSMRMRSYGAPAEGSHSGDTREGRHGQRKQQRPGKGKKRPGQVAMTRAMSRIMSTADVRPAL